MWEPLNDPSPHFGVGSVTWGSHPELRFSPLRALVLRAFGTAMCRTARDSGAGSATQSQGATSREPLARRRDAIAKCYTARGLTAGSATQSQSTTAREVLAPEARWNKARTESASVSPGIRRQIRQALKGRRTVSPVGSSLHPLIAPSPVHPICKRHETP
jgi:hypothetical protein